MPDLGARSILYRRAIFGIGSLGTGGFTTVPSVLLLYYLTSVVGLSPFFGGLVALLPKCISVILDPLIGNWSDWLSAQKRGSRAPMMAFGACVAAVGLFALFSIPVRVGSPFWAALAMYLVASTGYAMFAVPYSALPAELENDAAGRRAIVSLRMMFAFAGTITCAVGAPLLVDYFGGGAAGYAMMGFVLVITCGSVMLGCAIFCPRPKNVVIGDADQTIAHDLPPEDRRSFIRPLSAFIILLASAGGFSAALPYFVIDVLGAPPSRLSLAFLVNLGSAFVAATIWQKVISHFGPLRAWQIGAALMGIGAVLTSTCTTFGPAILVALAIGGAGFSGVQVSGFTALSEKCSERIQRRDRSTGKLTGLWTAGEKVGLALGPLLTGSVMAILIGPGGNVLATRIAVGGAPALLAVAGLCLLLADA